MTLRVFISTVFVAAVSGLVWLATDEINQERERRKESLGFLAEAVNSLSNKLQDILSTDNAEGELGRAMLPLSAGLIERAAVNFPQLASKVCAIYIDAKDVVNGVGRAHHENLQSTIAFLEVDLRSVLKEIEETREGRLSVVVIMYDWMADLAFWMKRRLVGTQGETEKDLCNFQTN